MGNQLAPGSGRLGLWVSLERSLRPLALPTAKGRGRRPAAFSQDPIFRLPTRQASPGPSTRVGGRDCRGAKKAPLRKIPAPDEEPLLPLSALLSLTKPPWAVGRHFLLPSTLGRPPLSPALGPGPLQVHARSGPSLCASPGARPCALSAQTPTDRQGDGAPALLDWFWAACLVSVPLPPVFGEMTQERESQQ